MTHSVDSRKLSSIHGALTPYIRWYILFIILLATVLRLAYLDQDSLWLDEIITQQIAGRTTEKLLKVIVFDDHPPMYYLLIHGLHQLLGTTDYAARLPSVFVGVLSIPFIFVLGRCLWGVPGGLFAATLLAVAPAHLLYSQEARQYALLFLFDTASMYFLYRAVLNGQKRHWLGYALMTTAALYSHYFSFIFWAGQAVFVAIFTAYVLIRRRDRGTINLVINRTFYFCLATSLSVVAFQPWYEGFSAQLERLMGAGGPNLNTPASSSLGAILTAGGELFSLQHPWLLNTLIILMICGIVYAIFVSFKSEKDYFYWRFERVSTYLSSVKAQSSKTGLALLFVLISMVVPIGLLGFVSSPHFFAARYILPVLTPILLLASAGLAFLFYLLLAVFSHRSNAAVVIVGGFSLIVLIGAIPVVNATYVRPKEDWRGAASYLLNHASGKDVLLGDGVFVSSGGNAKRVKQSLGYYLGDEERVMKVKLDEITELLASPHTSGTAWGILWYQGNLQPRELLPDAVEAIDFSSIVVLRVKEPSGDQLQDTVRILAALFKLQPLPQSLPDIHLALSSVKLELGAVEQAAAHVNLAAKSLSKNGILPQEVIHLIMSDPRILPYFIVYNFSDLLASADIIAPNGPFSHVEQTEFRIDESERAVLMMHPPSQVNYTLQVPENFAFLQTGLANDPETWHWNGDGVTFKIDITFNDETSNIFEQHVSLDDDAKKWHDILIDLKPYLGNEVTISFIVQAGPTNDFTGDRAGWSTPVLIGS